MSKKSSKKKEIQLKETMKALAADFDPNKEIKKLYPHRIIDATHYNRRFHSDRRAIGDFFKINAIEDLNSTIEKFASQMRKPRRKDWADIFIIYLVDGDPDNLTMAQEIMKQGQVKHSRIMIALPKQATKLGGHLLLYKTISTLAANAEDPDASKEWLGKCKELMQDLKAFIHWKNWNWFYMGGVIEKQDEISENGVISIFMEKIYPNSIDPGIRALGHHHRLSNKDRSIVKAAIERILNIDSPLIISREKTDKASDVLRQLASLMILSRVSKAGWEEEWEVQEPADKSPVKALWDELYKNILSRVQKGEEVSFKEVYDLFKRPPYGTTTAFLKVIFSLFWRCYHNQINLYNYGGGDRKTRESLTFQRLTSMVAHPGNWKIGLVGKTKDEKEFLNSIRSLFVSKEGDSGTPHSQWEDTKNALINWYDAIPEIIRKKPSKNSKTVAFLKMLARYKNKNGREIFMRYLPRILGFDPGVFNPAENGAIIISDLTVIVEELNNQTKSLVKSLWKTIRKILHLPIAKKKIEIALEKWLKRVSSDRFSSTYQGDCRILYEVITEDGERSIKDRLMEDLPQKMGIGTVREWQVNRLPEFAARLDKAVYHIKVMEYLELRELDDSRRKNRFIGKWLRKFIAGMNFEPEELESFLERYLEEIAG